MMFPDSCFKSVAFADCFTLFHYELAGSDCLLASIFASVGLTRGLMTLLNDYLLLCVLF